MVRNRVDFTETTGIAKMTKATKQTQTRWMSAGSAGITEITEPTGTQSENNKFPKQRVLGNGRNTVLRVLVWKRELTEFCSKLGEFCEKKKKKTQCLKVTVIKNDAGRRASGR